MATETKHVKDVAKAGRDDLGRVQYGRGPVRDSRSQLLHGAMPSTAHVVDRQSTLGRQP